MADNTKAAAIDTVLVRRLANILNDTGLTEIEIEKGDLKIRVAREVTVAQTSMAMAAPMAVAAPAPAVMQSDPAALPIPPAAAPLKGDEVKSPMVGTAYLQPSPGAAAFVKVGDTVKEGQTLLIIEAMKTMNPIPAPRAGTVSAVLVSDSQPVEFGEALVILE